MTEAEGKLWLRLHNRRLLHAKFRRQVPIGRYVADFLCKDHLLVVEVDGSQHRDNPRDVARDAWFAERGYRTLRFWNSDVLANTNGVLQTIAAHLQSSSAAAPTPFSPRGEGARRADEGVIGILLALTILCLPTPTQAADPATPTADIPTFTDEAASAGIRHTYDGSWEHFVGGGVAAFDCSGDRKPDLLFAGGANPARLFVNESPVGGELAFSEHALDLPDRLLKGVIGAYPLDIDGDAHLDLAVLRVGENLLLRGGLDCAFTLANRAWSFDGGRAWTTAFAATWEPGLAAPTLAIGNYVDRTAPGSPWGTCAENVLARPLKDTDAPDYSEPLPLDPGHCALSMLFTDWNRSGQAALRVTNDRHYYREGQEQLWQMRPDRPSRLFTAGEGWERLVIWGMGIAEADLDADGLPEYALTSMGDTKLQTLDEEVIAEDRPTYRDVAFERGATAHRPYAGGDIRPSTGWHAQFADVNNDGLTDLFIAKGNVEAMPDFAANDPDNLLLGRWDGLFAEGGEAAGLARPTRGRGAAVVDLNLDGMLDLVVVNRASPTAVFRNRGAAMDWGFRPLGNWLQVELSQEAATGPADIIGADWNGTNRTAVGAKLHIRVGTRTIVRQVQVGGGHASGQAGWIHVGLGVAERASVRVQWPDGAWSHPYRVFANQFAVLRRGAEEAAYWYPVE